MGDFMPSLMIHLTVAKKMIQKLDLNKKEEQLFYLGTIMPDSKKYKGSQDDIEYRKKVQTEKNINHFRKDLNRTLSYPNMNLFLNKYEEESKKDILVFAYLVHLYTDYYYFKYVLSKKITFYDEDKNKTESKDKASYVMISKTKEILSTRIFFGKQNRSSLYKEYERINPYIIEKYNIKLDKYLLKLSKKINIKVEEIRGTNINYEIEKLEELITREKQKEELRIFDIEEIYNFIDKVFDNIAKEYGYILKEIKLCYNNKRREDVYAK